MASSSSLAAASPDDAQPTAPLCHAPLHAHLYLSLSRRGGPLSFFSRVGHKGSKGRACVQRKELSASRLPRAGAVGSARFYLYRSGARAGGGPARKTGAEKPVVPISMGGLNIKQDRRRTETERSITRDRPAGTAPNKKTKSLPKQTNTHLRPAGRCTSSSGLGWRGLPAHKCGGGHCRCWLCTQL